MLRHLFNPLASAYKKARDLFAPLFAGIGEEAPTRNEMRLDALEWSVKRKLGHSFFTKKLSPKLRYKRVLGLTGAERALARNRGWI